MATVERSRTMSVSTVIASPRIHIRWQIRRDMPEVMAAEHLGRDGPMAESDMLRILRERNTIGMVAEVGEEVAGYMIYELHRERIHLVRLTTHPGWRRSGVGSALIVKLKGKLCSYRRTSITLTCPEEADYAGPLFLRRHGFVATGMAPDGQGIEFVYRFGWDGEVDRGIFGLEGNDR
jgi:ribosomal-protein-alanine N-acetyltransferase